MTLYATCVADEVVGLRAEVARLEAELRATRAVHDAAIESLPFDFWARDRDGVCVSQNTACFARWGKLVGHRPEDSDASPEVIAVWLANNARALAGEIVRGDVDYVVGGEVRHIHNILAPIRQGDEIVGTLGVNLDLTELRRLEHKLREAQRLETIGLLAGGVAHDINNIVMIILGMASMARRRAPAGSSLEGDLSTIETASRRAAAICNQLLAFAGKGHLDVELLEAGAVVTETVRLVAASLRSDIGIDVDVDRELAVEADPTQLRQLIMNLVLNAAEAIDQTAGGAASGREATFVGERRGTVAVRVAPAAPELIAVAAADDVGFVPAPGVEYVALEVRDTGGGMTPETRARIFEPFFTTKARGRGLGLAAALGTVRAHAGGLHVETRLGDGSSFRVLLPRATRPAVAPALAAPLERWRGSGAALVVDDDAEVAAAAARMLSDLGFEPIVCHGGAEALATLGDTTAPAVVLMDLMMPGLDGANTLRRIHASHPGVRVVLMSGFHDLAEPPLDMDVLAKPFSIDELAHAVRLAMS